VRAGQKVKGQTSVLLELVLKNKTKNCSPVSCCYEFNFNKNNNTKPFIRICITKNQYQYNLGLKLKSKDGT